MQFLRSFFKRIIDDVKQKKLIPLKILFFVHASTLFVLYPYLTIHMRELGIDVEETAVMSAVTPVVSIVMPPLAGMLADKIGNFRLLLGLSSALGGVSALLLLAVPVGRLTLTYPPAVELVARCESGRLSLNHVNNYPCEPTHPYAYDVTLTILSCGFVCELPQNISSELVDRMPYLQSYDIHIRSGLTAHLDYRHTVTSRRTPAPSPKTDQSSSRLLKNDPYFNISVSRVSETTMYFPAPNVYQMDCSLDSSNGSCIFGKSDILVSESNDNDMFRVRISHKIQKLKKPVNKFWIEAISPFNRSHPVNDPDYDGVDSITCNDNFSLDNTTGGPSDGVYVRAGGAVLRRCAAACAAAAPRKALCENQKQHLELDPVFTFWSYLVVRVFIGIIGGTAFAMFEGAVIAIVRDQRADYGLQRVYGSIGGMISSPLSGLLIDYASRGKGYTDFRPAFYLYAVLKVASGALMLSIDLQFKQPAQNLMQDVVTVFRNIEIVALFIACFIMGTAWGYIESFLFWLLQDLGASRSLMGITITVGGVAGLPLLVLSGPIISRLGHANVIFIGFVFYAIRLLGYSLIYNPWLCLIFEALESVTSSLSFTAAVTYAARLSSTTTDTSVQGLLGGIYYGVGKGSGSLIGGYLMKLVGTRTTYQIFATATLVTGCIYYLFNRFYLRKRITTHNDDICTKKPSILDVECRQTNDKEHEKTDGAVKKLENDAVGVNNTPKATDEKHDSSKTAKDNTDGGSDSGVDNPAYNETEMTNGKSKTEPTNAVE